MAKQKNPKAKEYPARIAFLTTDEQAARLRAHSKVTEPATEVPSTTVAPF
jgi:hypothetical protein